MSGAIRESTYDVDMTAMSYLCATNIFLHIANPYEHVVLSLSPGCEYLSTVPHACNVAYPATGTALSSSTDTG